MRLTCSILVLVVITTAGASRAWAQTNEEPFEQFQWNIATPGARANGMGRALVAVVDDASAALTNPAGLTNIGRPQASVDFRSTDLRVPRLAAVNSLVTGAVTTSSETTHALPLVDAAIPLRGNKLAIALTRHEFLDYQSAFHLSPRVLPDWERLRDVLEAAREVAEHALLLVVVVQDAPEAVVRARRAEDALRRHAVDRGILDEDDRRAPGVAERRERLHAARIPVGVELGDARDRRLRAGALQRSAAPDVDVGVPVQVHVVIEDLPHVVGDDVEHHLEVLVVRRRRELPELREIPEVRVRLREVLRPVAVVRVDVGVGLDVLHDGRDPQRGDAERLDVVEVIDEPLPVAALEAREVAGPHLVVVVHVAVGEAIDEHLVDDLVAPVVDVRGDGGLLSVVGHAHAADLGAAHAQEATRPARERSLDFIAFMGSLTDTSSS